MDNVLVSIIIPMFNSELFIRDTLSSLINQTYRNIEIIVVDDGSTDESKKIVLTEFTDDRIRYIYQNNKGAPTARNLGFNSSKGEYIIYFDADDVMDRDGVEKLVNGFDNTYYDIIVGDYQRIDSNGRKISQVRQPVSIQKISSIQNNIEKLKIAGFIDPLPGNKMFRKSFLLDNMIEYADLKIGQDLNFYLKSLGFKPKINFISSKIYSYRVHSSSISKKISTSFLDIIECFEIIEAANFEIYKNFPYILETLKYNHYSYHLYKIPFISDKEDRVQSYLKLKNSFKEIKLEFIKDEFINVNKRKVILAIKFPKLYTSKLLSHMLRNK